MLSTQLFADEAISGIILDLTIRLAGSPINSYLFDPLEGALTVIQWGMFTWINLTVSRPVSGILMRLVRFQPWGAVR